jgi:hypothetical protein
MFAPMYDEFTSFVDEYGFITRKISARRRHHLLNPMNCLELLMKCSHTRGSLMVHQLLVVTMCPVAKYLQFARRSSFRSQ